MSDLRAAAQQALEALHEISWSNDTQWQSDRAADVIPTLRAALAQPEPEPVAWTPAELAASLKRGEKWKLVEPAAEPVEPTYKRIGCVGHDCEECQRKAQQPAPEPAQDQDIEDAVEAAYWYFDARKKGLNEWASAPQSERDAFKAEGRRLARGYFPTRQAQDTEREMPAPGADPAANANARDNLYWRLHSLSKSLESSGRIDEQDTPDAYPTLLDAMIALRSPESSSNTKDES